MRRESNRSPKRRHALITPADLLGQPEGAVLHRPRADDPRCGCPQTAGPRVSQRLRPAQRLICQSTYPILDDTTAMLSMEFGMLRGQQRSCRSSAAFIIEGPG